MASSNDASVVRGASAPRGSPIGFVVRLLLVLFCFYYAYTRVKHSQAFEAHREILAVVAAGLLRVFYRGVEQNGTMLSMPGPTSVDVGEGCDAIFPILCFVGGVLAFSAPLRAKLLGLLVGLGLIELLNVVRIASLLVILRHRPEWFHAAHTRVWETVFVLFSVSLWGIWALRALRRDEP